MVSTSSDASAARVSGSPRELTVAPTGYSVVLPPGWRRLPIREATEPAIERLLDRAFAPYPRDQVATVRREVRRRLVDAAAQAREASALDVYLPAEPVGKVILTCSFVVSEISLVGVEDVDPTAVLARLLAQDHTQHADLPAAFGARSDRVVAAEGLDLPDQEPVQVRRVDYVLPVPADPERWVLVSFTTFGAGDAHDGFAALQVELFDAIMTTFRWQP